MTDAGEMSEFGQKVVKFLEWITLFFNWLITID